MSHGRLRPWLLLLGLLCNRLYAADINQVYSGTLGAMPVVVELQLADPAQVSGRYFYVKYHRDLALSGALQNDELSLDEGQDDYQDTPRPKLNLTRDNAGGWQGQWLDPKGKVLAVKLHRAELPPAGNADPFFVQLREHDPYEYLRLSQLPLAAGKAETFMGYGLKWQAETESKISLFEVTSGYPADALARVNPVLRARLWSEVISYQECMLNSSRFGEGDFEQTVTPTYFSPAVLSASVFTSYFCGGAHPDFGDNPINLNVNTGQALALEDVLWLGDGAPWHYDRPDGNGDAEDGSVTFDTYSAYREKYLAPFLVQQFQKLYPEEMKKPADENDCDYSDPQIWNFPSWHFTAKGIYFGPGFARVMRACESPEWSVLPWSVLGQHPGGVRLELPKG
ncbi:hypothetical protein [Pseudomonas abieticivorans]|uniref:hypothetical protein n=1 Tax=Pseudomonas abieticivorans TaxID=2931382 RepID=UPI0020C122BF|nr:hypothetical protein [Pseudomonas sp. PIA16]